ncbi:MAG: sigma-54-dependent Fis family transcriptional regulator [Deltaproteobacteria bacterium]|nr:sigma-54-dependent Fis family transcriptional regulator [Deltaproteobacteria bacterium]
MSTQARILVVDDDPELCEILSEVLTRLDFDVKTALDGQEALDLLKKDGFDLVITDLDMPVVGGLTFLRKVRRAGGDIPFIFMTGHGTVEAAVEAMKCGASDFVQKPFPLNEMKALVSGVLKREQEKSGYKEPSEKHGSAPEIITRNATMKHLIVGKFELADTGTLLLDEISEMAPTLQAKLLRVLQEYEITRLGGKNPIKLNVRVVATTNRDLDKDVQEGRFREDLFYRLNVIPLRIPPLRERREDIPFLVSHFVKKACQRDGKPVKDLTVSAMETLQNHDWKGNVRELENTIERAVLISMNDPIDREHLLLPGEAQLPSPLPSQPDETLTFHAGHTIREVEKNMILHTLGKVDGNRTHAAKMLGISIRTLRNKINEYRERGEISDV